MKYLILGAIIFIIITFIRLRRRTEESIEPPAPARWYKRIPALFTPAEQHFLMSLEMALEGVPVRIYGKTRMADLIKVRRGMTRSDYSAAFNKIRSKHVDFVLVHPLTYTPLLAIELDDSSHQRKDRQLRDATVDEIFEQAGLPIMHVPLRKRYSEQHLRDDIIDILKQYKDSLL